MGKIPQTTPVPLVTKKSLCFLRITQKRHSDRNNPIFSIQFPLLIQFLLLASLLRIFYHIKESQQCKYVRDNHQSIKEVGHIPNQIYLKRCTDDDANHNDCGVQFYCSFTKQVLNIYRTEEVPSKYCRKGKEEKTEGNEEVTEVTEAGHESLLCQTNTGKSLSCCRINCSKDSAR